MKVKICGITNLEDALLAVQLGADALGFIFYEKSPRAVSVDTARFIIKHLPPFVTSVGVFVQPSRQTVDEIVGLCGLHAVQMHGSCELAGLGCPVICAVSVSSVSDLAILPQIGGKASAVLLDTKKEGYFGGTGEIFDWSIAVEAKKSGLPIILAGGLDADCVGKAIDDVNPYGVDASSGLEERPGKKDPQKLRAFFQAIKQVLANRA